MKRKILFRGKRIDNGEWVYGYYFQSVYMANEGVTDVSNIRNFPKGDVFHVDLKTVGQYTGLKDKNGVKIFEGDIVDQGSHDIAEVFFRSGSFSTYICKGMWLEMSQNGFEFEVIGNIYDKTS